MTTQEVKARLIGLLPYIEQIPAELEEEVFGSAIAAAIDETESDLGIYLRPRRIAMWPEVGQEYDVEEPPLPYDPKQFLSAIIPVWRLRRRPVISVQRVRLAFGERREDLVISVPKDWWRVNKRLGTISLMPIGASAVAMQAGAVWFAPLLAGRFPVHIPQFVAIDYTAGIDWEAIDDEDKVDYARLRRLVAERAAIFVCNDLRRLVPSSVSAGGLSQAYASIDETIRELNASVEAYMQKAQQQFRPMRVGVI